MIQKSKFVQGLGLMVVLTLLLGGVFSAYALPDPGEPNWTFTVDDGDDAIGYSVSTGDVNGDGYDDIIVGAPDYDRDHNGEGLVFVWLGSSAGLGDNGTPGNADWLAESNQIDAKLGRSVSAADVNGDGYDDVIVGAPLYDNGQTNEGAVFVWYGSSTGLGGSGTPSNADWMAQSNQAYAQFGYSVSTAGNIRNVSSGFLGDPIEDIIVGAPFFYDNGQTNEGVAFVWYGSTAGLGSSGTPTNADWTAESDQAGAEFGHSVGTAGDVNGDDYDDVIVGAHFYDNDQTNEGAAFVYTGTVTGLSTTAAWTAESDVTNAEFGYSVGTAGDVDDDGFDDVIIGSLWEHKSYAYYGSATGLDDVLVISGVYSFGYSVSTAGDVNDDGYDDVIIGSPWYNGNTGQADVYYGSSTGLDTSADWTDVGENSGDHFGWSVGTAGNVNSGDYDDVIIGASNFSDGDGKAYVYHGDD